jgi:hypothetical protein
LLLEHAGAKGTRRADESIIVFSFYPDILTIKEVGDRFSSARVFGLESCPKGKDNLPQGRQNAIMP